MCAAERQTTLPASASCSSSTQLALLGQDLAPLKSQSCFLWVKSAWSQQQWPRGAASAAPHLAHPQAPKPQLGWLGCAHPEGCSLCCCSVAWQHQEGFGEGAPEAGAGEVRAGSHRPGGSPALGGCPLWQLGGVESQRVMEELVLLARLDHPTPARERQGPLTLHRHRTLLQLSAPRAQTFPLHQPCQDASETGSRAAQRIEGFRSIAGLFKMRLAAGLVLIFTCTS